MADGTQSTGLESVSANQAGPPAADGMPAPVRSWMVKRQIPKEKKLFPGILRITATELTFELVKAKRPVPPIKAKRSMVSDCKVVKGKQKAGYGVRVYAHNPGQEKLDLIFWLESRTDQVTRVHRTISGCRGLILLRVRRK